MSEVLSFLITATGILAGAAIILFIVFGSAYMAYKRITARFFTKYIYTTPVRLLLAVHERDIKVEGAVDIATGAAMPDRIIITFQSGHQAALAEDGRAWIWSIDGTWQPLPNANSVYTAILNAPVKQQAQPAQQSSKKQKRPQQQQSTNNHKPSNGSKSQQPVADLKKVEHYFKKGKTWQNRPNVKLPRPYHWSQDQYTHEWQIARH